MEKTLQKTWVVCLMAMVSCILWGSAFPCVKIGYRLFNIATDDTATLILFAGMRFTLAGIVNLLLGSLLMRKPMLPKKSSWKKIAVISLFQTVLQYILFYIGLAHTTGVKASIMIGSNVFIAIVVSALIFRIEKLTLRKCAGCLLGFAGVVLINLSGLGGEFNFTLEGDGLMLLSTVAYSCSSVIMKRYSRDEAPVLLSAYQFLLGGIAMLLVGFALGGRITTFSPAAGGMLLYLGTLSAVAYSLWAILLKYNPVSKVAVFGFINPICGVTMSALLLGESGEAFTLTGVTALALVCLGIYVVNRRGRKVENENEPQN